MGYRMTTLDGYDPEWAWRWARPDASQELDDEDPSAPLGESEAGMDDAGAAGAADQVEAAPSMGAYPMGPQFNFPGQGSIVFVPVNTTAGGYMMPGAIAVPMTDQFQRWPAHADMPQDMSAVGQAAVEEKESLPRLQQAFSVFSNIYRVRWTVDSRKLNSLDREHVSPEFQLGDGPEFFKMVMKPKEMEEGRGGASFRRAKGKGTVQLRIVANSETSSYPTVTFRLSVGSGGNSRRRQQRARGPVTHDFSERVMAGLQQGRDEWDFRKAVDESTETFVVCLEGISSHR